MRHALVAIVLTLTMPAARSEEPAVSLPPGEVTTTAGDGTLVLSRTLRLDRTTYDPEAWPDLRALLLAAGNNRHRTVLVR